MNDVKRDYEPIRLTRYSGVSMNVHYSESDLSQAHRAWAEACIGRRYPEWDAYCDVRDGVPKGTNQAIRQGKLRERFH